MALFSSGTASSPSIHCTLNHPVGWPCSICDAKAPSISDEQIAQSREGLERAIDKLLACAMEWKRKAIRYEADLHECLEFLEGQVDVVDGDYGVPAPNKAMQLTTMIKETLGQ